MAYTSTRLRFLFAGNPQELCQMIEALPTKVEIKTISLGMDKRWYAWFTIIDNDPDMYNNKKQKKTKGE